MPEEIICPDCSRVITSENGVCTHGETPVVEPVEEVVSESVETSEVNEVDSPDGEPTA